MTTSREAAKRFTLSIVGMVLLAFAINLISWQFRLVSGGMPGYALIINYLTDISVGTTLFAINTIIISFSFVLGNKSIGAKAVFGYIFLSVFIDLSRTVLNLQQTELNSFAVNSLLLVVQGLLAPIGVALVLANGYSFGGYSTLIPIIEKFRHVNAPVMFWVLDTILAVIVLFIFGVDKSIYLFINAVAFYFSFRYFFAKFKKMFSGN
jgi:uncharacterized membrane-anchored protein YitT (DUF2179 family)